MEHLDYYTVMESRIKYFAFKYDPQNKLGNAGAKQIRKTKLEPISAPVDYKKTPVKAKLQRKLDFVIAMFL